MGMYFKQGILYKDNKPYTDNLLQIALVALCKIRDPRKRHAEPDKYTEVGCIMNMADEAVEKLSAMGVPLPELPDVNPGYGTIPFDVHKL